MPLSRVISEVIRVLRLHFALAQAIKLNVPQLRREWLVLAKFKCFIITSKPFYFHMWRACPDREEIKLITVSDYLEGNVCNKHSRNLKLDSPDLIWDRSHTAGAALSPSLPSAMDAHINDEKKASELACSARKMMVIVRWWYDAFFRVSSFGTGGCVVSCRAYMIPLIL